MEAQVFEKLMEQLLGRLYTITSKQGLFAPSKITPGEGASSNCYFY